MAVLKASGLMTDVLALRTRAGTTVGNGWEETGRPILWAEFGDEVLEFGETDDPRVVGTVVPDPDAWPDVTVDVVWDRWPLPPDMAIERDRCGLLYEQATPRVTHRTASEHSSIEKCYTHRMDRQSHTGLLSGCTGHTPAS